MPENLKPILSALRKLEFRNEDSLPRLIFFNSQAQFAVLNSLRNRSEGYQQGLLVQEAKILQLFRLNYSFLKNTSTLPVEIQKSNFYQVQKSLCSLISSIISQIENSSSRRREFHLA